METVTEQQLELRGVQDRHANRTLRPGTRLAANSPAVPQTPLDEITAWLRDVVEQDWDLSQRVDPSRFGEHEELGWLLVRLFKKMQASMSGLAGDIVSLSHVAPELERIAESLTEDRNGMVHLAAHVGRQQRLSDDLGAHLSEIRSRLEMMQQEIVGQVGRMEPLARGMDPGAAAKLAGEQEQLANFCVSTMNWVGSHLDAMEKKIATDTGDLPVVEGVPVKPGVGAINVLTRQLHETCDSLVQSVGTFRLAAHQKARMLVEEAARHPDILSMDREHQEAYLGHIMEWEAFFELLYITDSQGVQITDNITKPGFHACYDGTGLGKDWSARPWFTGAVYSRHTHVSDVYRSAASGAHCFTVSTPVYAPDGELLAVLAADVRFADILKT